MSDPTPKKVRAKKVQAPAPLPSSLPIVPPKKGHCKPKRLGPPQSQEEERLARAIKDAEARRDLAAAEYGKDRSVATELGLMQADLEVASAWSSYLRATNNHTHSIKWGELGSKYAARVSQLRELRATDLLQELADRSARENAAAIRVGRIR